MYRLHLSCAIAICHLRACEPRSRHDRLAKSTVFERTIRCFPLLQSFAPPLHAPVLPAAVPRVASDREWVTRLCLALATPLPREACSYNSAFSLLLSVLVANFSSQTHASIMAAPVQAVPAMQPSHQPIKTIGVLPVFAVANPTTLIIREKMLSFTGDDFS